MPDKWEWVALPAERPARCDDKTTLERIVAIIREQADLSEGMTIGPETRFIDMDRADSGAIVMTLIAVEEQFETRIPDEAAETMATIQDLVDYLGANPQRYLLRPAAPPYQGIVLLRPAGTQPADPDTLLRASEEALRDE